MNDVRRQWELRAQNSPTCLSGVLFQGLSEQSNSILHEWHAWIVRTQFLPRLPHSARILDLGCGYGRLSKVIATERPDIQLIGQDLALDYCRMFIAACGPCALADASAPPFLPASFDGVMAITCLMYVPDEALTHTLAALHSILRINGVMLSIDPGYELQHLIARLRGKKSRSLTGGQGFEREQYVGLFKPGFQVASCGGNRHLSRALIVPGVAASQRRWIGAILARAGKQDRLASGYDRFALHRWVLAKKAGP